MLIDGLTKVWLLSKDESDIIFDRTAPNQENAVKLCLQTPGPDVDENGEKVLRWQNAFSKLSWRFREPWQTQLISVEEIFALMK